MVMIKDNHIAAAGGIGAAVRATEVRKGAGSTWLEESQTVRAGAGAAMCSIDGGTCWIKHVSTIQTVTAPPLKLRQEFMRSPRASG